MKTNAAVLILIYLFALSCSKEKIGNLYPKEELDSPNSTTSYSMDTLEETPLPEDTVEVITDTLTSTP